MSNLEEKPSKPDVVERSMQVRNYVDQVIKHIGEHPEVELKREWRYTTPHGKAECIRDIQSIANSEIAIDSYKLIVIGVAEDTRDYVGCDHSAFDDATLRLLFEAYLDPAPEFEVMRLHSPEGIPYVVLRIPRQAVRPLVTRKELGDGRRTLINTGEVWVKPGEAETASSGKRKVQSRAELLKMFDIEHLVEAGVRSRLDAIIPIMRRELAAEFRPQTMTTPSALTATDEEIESFITFEIAEGRASRWQMWIEQLRDHTKGLWSLLGRENKRLSIDEFRHLVQSDFQPVMDRVLLTGLLTIKYDGGVERFREIVDLLVEIFACWRDAQQIAPRQNGARQEPLQIISSKVPALEAYFIAFALLGYTLRITPDSRYIWALFPQIVSFTFFGETDPHEEALLFWRYYYDEGPTNWIDDLITSRMPRGSRIDKLFEGEAGLQEAIVQADCFIEWNSNLSQKEDEIGLLGDDDTIKFYQIFFPNLKFDYTAVCLRRSYRLIMPLLEKMYRSILSDAKQFLCLDARLSHMMDAMSVERRKGLFGRFLWYLERKQASIYIQMLKGPPTVYWPKPLGQLVELAKAESPKKLL